MAETLRRQTLLVYLALALILTTGLAFRVLGVAVRPGLDHDEAMHLLVATCNQQPYKQVLAQYQSSELRTTSIAEWQEFIHVRNPLCFGTIASDLREWEVHPPLYLWLLNLWMSLLGDSLFAIRCLNVVVDVASILALFYVSRDLLGRKYALLAAALYALTPACLKISGQARSYALLVLCNLVALWAILQITRKPTAWHGWIVWAWAVSIGLVAEYMFVVVFAPMALYMLLFFLKRKRLLWKQFIASALIISPFVIGIAWLYWQQKNYAADYGWSPEGRHPAAALLFLFLDIAGGVKPERLSDGFSLLVANVMAVGVSVYSLWAIKDRGIRWLFLLLFSTTVFGPILFYTLGLSPPWAYGAKYQSTAVPYIILAVVYFISRLGHRRLRVLAALILMGSFALALAFVIRFKAAEANTVISPDTINRLPYAELVIIDIAPEYWGMLYPATSSWPDTQRVLIAGQKKLLRGAALREAIRNKGSILYVSDLWHGDNTINQRHQILSLLQSEFDTLSPESTPSPLANLRCLTGGVYQVYFFDRHESSQLTHGHIESAALKPEHVGAIP